MLALARLPQQIVDQHLGMDLLLDVERRRVDDEVAPVLLVLAAPDELRVEVAVAALVGDADRALLAPSASTDWIFRRRNVLARRLVVRERLDGLLSLLASVFLAMLSFRLRGCGGDGFDHLVELAFDLGLEVGFDLVDVGELGEGPAAVRCRGCSRRAPSRCPSWTSSPWRPRGGSP